MDIAVAVTVLVGVFAATNAEHLLGGIDDFLVVRITAKNVALLAGFVLAWPVLFVLFGLYDVRVRISVKEEALRVFAACTVGTLITLPFLLTSRSGAFQVRTLFYFWIGVVVANLLTRYLFRVTPFPSRSSTTRDVLVVGSGPRAINLYRKLTADSQHRYRILGFIDSVDGLLPEIGQRTIGSLDDLESYLMHEVVDEVLIALPIKSCYSQIQHVITVCERAGVEAHYLADVFKHSVGKPRYEHSAVLPLVSLKIAPDDLRLVAKRGMDICGAAIGLVLLAPLFVVIAAAIKLTSPGPILFTQKRYGHSKRLFGMYKFRTMVPDAESLLVSIEHLNEVSGPAFKIAHDPRLTPIGAFLRSTSLDELPQLVNVLKGEMSLVGPRPMSVRDVRLFPEAWLMRRFSVTPGCSCLWQISGRSNLAFSDWIALDLRYIDNWSLTLDLKILVKTIPAVLKGRGAV
ncbi:MAG: sugar transferase [Gemmatimonadetes bacterium]|nr:sugar transferase [Gemmatimonadota bacterium]